MAQITILGSGGFGMSLAVMLHRLGHSVTVWSAFEEELENQCLQADVPYLTETIIEECESVIRLLMSSKANTVIIPMHDILCLDNSARMNAPSTVSGNNWTFRFTEKDFKKRKAAWLASMAEEYQR